MQTLENEFPTTEPQNAAIALPPLYQIWFHEEDIDCLKRLNPFLHRMNSRLGDIACNIFGYHETPKPPDLDSCFTQKRYQEALEDYEQAELKYQKHHAWSLEALPRTLLLVIFASNAFIAAFELDLKANERLAETMEHPPFQMLPFPVRPTETGKPFPCLSLCSLDGVQLDEAFVEITAVIEKLVRAAFHLEPPKTAVELLFQSQATIQPSLVALKTSTDLALETLASLKDLVPQMLAQVVESQQQAIAERSAHLAIEQSAQMERENLSVQRAEVNQQLAALQNEQKVGLFTRLRRLFFK